MKRILLALLFICAAGGSSQAAFQIESFGPGKQYRRSTGGGTTTDPIVFIDDVYLQDQRTPPFLIKASKVEGSTTLTSQANIGDTVINVTSAVGISADKYLGLFNTVTDRYYAGNVISVDTLAVTMDTQVDSVFEIGDIVGFGITNMNVNGSLAVPIEFNVRGADPGVDITIDITEITFVCITTAAIDLTDFGDIENGLTNGIVIQHVDSYTKNIINFKTNMELKGWAPDFEAISEANPGTGLYGFTATLNFSGPENMGVTLRIGAGEKLSFYIQDDLRTILSLEALIKGHEVD